MIPCNSLASAVDKIFGEYYGDGALEKFQRNDEVFSSDLDSLDRIELIMAIEERFDISIDEDRAFSLKTRSDVLKLVDAEVQRAT